MIPKTTSNEIENTGETAKEAGRSKQSDRITRKPGT